LLGQDRATRFARAAINQPLPDNTLGHTDMKNRISRLVWDDQGQDLIEYAMLAGFIALSCVVAISLLGGSLAGGYNNIAIAIGSVGT
jgi:Flp pilus assembly pilin Flp